MDETWLSTLLRSFVARARETFHAIGVIPIAGGSASTHERSTSVAAKAAQGLSATKTAERIKVGNQIAQGSHVTLPDAPCSIYHVKLMIKIYC